MNLFDNPLVGRPQLVLHLHRLHHHQTLADLDHLALRHFHAHDEPRHRRFDHTAGGDLAPLTRQRLDLLRAVVLNLDRDPLADRPEGPAASVAGSQGMWTTLAPGADVSREDRSQCNPARGGFNTAACGAGRLGNTSSARAAMKRAAGRRARPQLPAFSSLSTLTTLAPRSTSRAAVSPIPP